MLRVGFEVRVTVLTDDGEEVTVMLTRTHARALGLEEGQKVWLSPAGGATHGADDAGGLRRTTDQGVRRGPARRTPFCLLPGQPPVARTSRWWTSRPTGLWTYQVQPGTVATSQ